MGTCTLGYSIYMDLTGLAYHNFGAYVFAIELHGAFGTRVLGHGFCKQQQVSMGSIGDQLHIIRAPIHFVFWEGRACPVNRPTGCS